MHSIQANKGLMKLPTKQAINLTEMSNRGPLNFQFLSLFKLLLVTWLLTNCFAYFKFYHINESNYLYFYRTILIHQATFPTTKGIIVLWVSNPHRANLFFRTGLAENLILHFPAKFRDVILFNLTAFSLQRDTGTSIFIADIIFEYGR